MLSNYPANIASRITVLTLLLSLAVAQHGLAQGENGAEEKPPSAKPELGSPRATLATFLRTTRDKETHAAIDCIDLEGLTPEAVNTGGPALTFQLRVAIDRFVDLKLPEAGAVDEEGPDVERWKTLPAENGYEQPFPLSQVPEASPLAKVLVLRRYEDGNWRFSRDTRLAVESLYTEIEQEQRRTDEPVASADLEVPLTIRLRNWFSPWLTKPRFLIPDYQWLCLAALFGVGLAADWVARVLLTFFGNRYFRKIIEESPPAEGDEEQDAEASTAAVWRPMGRLVNAAVWYQGAKVIGLPSSALSVLLGVLKLFTIVAAAWTAFTIIDLVSRYLAQKSSRAGARFDDLLIPFAARTLKFITVGVALLTAAQAFGLPLLGLVGGLGLGGAALALASKDAVANFFGSVTVLFDRPFEVGDYIITDGVEGTVESVGFRSTRLRTFSNSLVTLPNSLLTTSVVDNMGARHYRRVKAVLSLEYGTTPEQIDAFCEGVRQLIREHEHTRKDSFHVYFNAFGPSSLDVIVYCFLKVPDWGFELQEKHRLFADILRLAEKLGVRFAFPTQTLHLSPSDIAELPRAIHADNWQNPQESGRSAAKDVLSDKAGSQP